MKWIIVKMFVTLLANVATAPRSSTPQTVTIPRRQLSIGEKLYKVILAVWATAPLFGTYYAFYKAYREKKIGKWYVAIFFLRWFFTGQGITAGFHRLATHKSYKAHPVVKLVLLILGSVAGQGKVINWVSFHRKHHEFADKPGDPHSPHTGGGEGFWETMRDFIHSHIGWMFYGDPPDREKYGRDLMKDPIISFVDRTFYIWFILGHLIPFLLRGRKGLLWGGLVPMFFVNHATFAVNSVCHIWGKRRFDTDDESRNNWFIAILTGGEGNHNNHHANQRSPYHGMKGDYDPTAAVIKGLVKVGLADVDPKMILTEENAPKVQQRLLQMKTRRAQKEA